MFHEKNPLTVYYCGRERCESGHSFGPAVRPHYLIHFIYEGRGTYTIKGKREVLKAGDAFLIPPGEITYYEADQREPWVYGWTAFDGRGAESLLNQCGLQEELVYRGNGSGDEEIWKLIGRMTDRLNSAGHNELESIGYLCLIFSRMVKEKESTGEWYGSNYCRKACEYIKHNYSYDIKVTDIARYIGVDRTYLYKIFIQEKGISPQRYLLRQRLNEAKNLLDHSAFNITEIALSCGFKDSASFCRHFKEKTKMTPKEYRTRQESYGIQ